MEKKQLEKYLQQYIIPKTNGYVLGVFQPGITVYNQQLRSLNILHAMIETGALKKDDEIAVIGGGIAGLTFSTAALKLGYSIDLFEKSHILIPYQYACETRRIHPHFYTWPEPLSEYPYCDLPFFNWSHETASTVAKNIYDTFRSISRNTTGTYREYKGKKLSDEDISWGAKKTTIQFDSGEGQIEKRYTKVIVATGFGIEKRIELNVNAKTKETISTCISYWRNDEFEQASLTKDDVNRYVISGSGDGALMDMFRFTLRGFTIKMLLDKLKGNSKEFKELKFQLREIRRKYQLQSPSQKVKQNNFLFNSFEELRNNGFLTGLTAIVKGLARKDTFIILHHRNLTINQLLDLRRASMFNNLLAYVLLSNSICGFKEVAFDVNYALWSKDDIYQSNEELENIEKKVNDNDRQLSRLLRSLRRKYPDQINEGNVKLILRHGTEIEESLKYIGITINQIEKIKKNQLADLSSNHLSSIWVPGWWNDFFKANDEPVEFVEPELVLTCNSFVSTLSKMIELIAGIQSDFRVVLHRVIKKSDLSFFQQVSYYFGNQKVSKLKGPVGRIFPLDIGIVGYTCKTGRSLLLRKLEDYEITWNALMTLESDRKRKNFSDFKDNRFTSDKLESVDTLFTCPILSKTGSDTFPIFCLYINSQHLNFEDAELLRVIYSASESFVNLLTRTASDQKIIQTEDLSESLVKIDLNYKNQSFNKVIEGSKSLKAVDLFNEYKEKLTFVDLTPHYMTTRF